MTPSFWHLEVRRPHGWLLLDTFGDRDSACTALSAVLRDFPPGDIRLRRERSDRTIAAAVGVDHVTVGKARDTLTAGGEIHHVAETKGADGKTYPRAKAKAAA